MEAMICFLCPVKTVLEMLIDADADDDDDDDDEDEDEEEVEAAFLAGAFLARFFGALNSLIRLTNNCTNSWVQCSGTGTGSVRMEKVLPSERMSVLLAVDFRFLPITPLVEEETSVALPDFVIVKGVAITEE